MRVHAILLLDETIVSYLIETGYKYLMTHMIMGLFHSTVWDSPTRGIPFLCNYFLAVNCPFDVTHPCLYDT